MALPSKKLRIIIVLSILALGGLGYWTLHHGLESTDDAQLDATVVTISPKVAGYVKTLPIASNQRVKKGDVLLEIDPADYILRRDRAQAAVDSATAQAEIAAANQEKAQKDLQRIEALGKLASSRQQLDDASTINKTTNASLIEANARLQQAQVDLAQAEKDLNDTKIIAPIDGKITERGVEQGNYVQPGQQLLYLVDNDLSVVANFKETQLGRMKIGQPVAIEIDSFPDHHFSGTIESFQAGTGARFSTFPPENATGNFVKIVQRVPVKIHFDKTPDPSLPIGPGMSVIATVNTR